LLAAPHQSTASLEESGGLGSRPQSSGFPLSSFDFEESVAVCRNWVQEKMESNVPETSEWAPTHKYPSSSHCETRLAFADPRMESAPVVVCKSRTRL